MRYGTLATVVLAAGTLVLSACGESSSPTRMDDPRVDRLEGILEQSDTLLVSSVHRRYSLSAVGRGTLGDRTVVVRMSCTGANCTGDDGTEMSTQDMANYIERLRSPGVGISSRGGFETILVEAPFEAPFEAPEGFMVDTGTTVLSTTCYGFWGEHGFGNVIFATNTIAGSFEGATLTSDFGSASASVGGSAAGTNPTGMGSATWSGIAEAASIGDFQRHEGTATITIADLSDPRVGVDIDIPGRDIGPPDWADMSLVDGRFTSGSVDTGDYLEGNFHGPDHSETYGVFETGTYIGAFGAKRNQ